MQRKTQGQGSKGVELDRYRTYICTWNGIEVHPELSAKGGGKGAVRSMRYLQFIAAMGIQMGKGRIVGGGAREKTLINMC